MFLTIIEKLFESKDMPFLKVPVTSKFVINMNALYIYIYI